MRRFKGRVLVLIAGAATTACALAGQEVKSATMERLCQHVKERKMLVVDRSQPDVVWSDGAMFEIARNFPPELETLLAAPTATRDLHAAVSRLAKDVAQPEWQDAKIIRPRAGQDQAVVEAGDGKPLLRIASPYAAYILERYPRARIRVKGALNPVLVHLDGALRAAVMPVAMPAAARPAVSPDSAPP